MEGTQRVTDTGDMIWAGCSCSPHSEAQKCPLYYVPKKHMNCVLWLMAVRV